VVLPWFVDSKVQSLQAARYKLRLMCASNTVDSTVDSTSSGVSGALRDLPIAYECTQQHTILL
jgi:hypothetical protein